MMPAWNKETIAINFKFSSVWCVINFLSLLDSIDLFYWEKTLFFSQGNFNFSCDSIAVSFVF